MSLPVSDCKLPVARPFLPLFQSPSSSFSLLLLPLFQTLSPSFSLPLLPLVHPLSPISIPPSRLSGCSCHLTLILFPLPTFPPPRRYHKQKTARKPPFHRSSGRSSFCYVLRLSSVKPSPSVSLSFLPRQSAQYIQTWRSVYSDRPLSI